MQKIIENKKLILIIVTAIVVVLALGLLLFSILNSDNSSKTNTDQSNFSQVSQSSFINNFPEDTGTNFVISSTSTSISSVSSVTDNSTSNSIIADIDNIENFIKEKEKRSYLDYLVTEFKNGSSLYKVPIEKVNFDQSEQLVDLSIDMGYLYDNQFIIFQDGEYKLPSYNLDGVYLFEYNGSNYYFLITKYTNSGIGFFVSDEEFTFARKIEFNLETGFAIDYDIIGGDLRNINIRTYPGDGSPLDAGGEIEIENLFDYL